MAALFWVMLAGAAVIWVIVIGSAVYASRIRQRPHNERVGRWFVLGGGVAFPVVVLAVLLSYGLSLMSDLRISDGGMKIAVSGERWWWRVTYLSPEFKGEIRSANEIRLPLGERVELQFESPDIIHSFWVPSLGGKMDIIPGRTNRLVLEPSRTGAFRGVCAEFCGTSHALMAFSVVVMEPGAFADWIAHEAAPARQPETDIARRGASLFQDVGCGGCHTIRGTSAKGVIGPDLTHLAGRSTLAAGTLPMTQEALKRWIGDPESLKPGVRMPAFGMLGDKRTTAITAYLMTLK